jgi:hypothetical protein
MNAPLSTAPVRAARCTLSYESAEWQHRNGYMTDNEWRWYQFFWTWTAPRFGGAAAAKQERAYQRLGRERYLQRRERVRELWARLRNTPIQVWPHG